MTKNPKNLRFLPEFYHPYVLLLPEDDAINALRNNAKDMLDFLNGIADDQGNFAYAAGKWTVKEVISHIVDTERIFAYRALRFSRNDQCILSAFDENAYVPNSNAANRKLSDLLTEFDNLRRSTLDLYQSFTDEMMRRYGQCNDTLIGVDALAFVIAGHAAHHRKILSERYSL